MNNLLATIGIVISAGAMHAQVNVYECGVTNPYVSSAEVLNGAFGFYRPCIVFDANTDFLFSGDVHKDIKASEYIHIKEGFHAGLFNAGKGVHLRIDEKALYDVSVLNYPDLNAIEKYKKVEFGVDLEGEIEDRIKAFINLTDGTAPTLYHLNPFIEDDMNDLTSEISMHATFIHPQTWTVKERDFFYYHEYEQIGPGYGVDVANHQTGELGWSDAINDNNDYLMRVRFAPPRAGEWEAHFSITYDGNTIELPVFTFLVQDNNHPGLVKVHNNQRNLQRDNGIVFPVSHVFPGPYNRAETVHDQTPWGYPHELKSEYNTKVKDWNQYLGDIESYINQGGKSIKLAQTSYGNLIEFEELGNYRKRLHYAWEQDKILEMCEENDVLINFNLLFQDVIMGYGQNGRLVNENVPGNYYGEPWDYGDYGPQRIQVGNGYEPIKLGDQNSPVEGNDYFKTFCYFVPGTLPSHQFLDPILMNYHKQRTRYYVARYGYSPQIYTWELMSEPLHMDEFAGGIILNDNVYYIADTPADIVNHSSNFHPGHHTAVQAIDTYHTSLSNYIKNELKDQDHLITMCVSPLESSKVTSPNFDLQSLDDINIDILGLNLYSGRPDKLIIGKPDKNGKNNLNITYHQDEDKNETSEYKNINEIFMRYSKPIILSEVGHQSAGCSGTTGNIIDVMTFGFSGVAGLHPWEGYIYNQTEYDQRLLWPSTIYAEHYMNSTNVTTTLNDWNGVWKQGRQVAFVKENPAIGPDEKSQVRELQYYLSQSNEFATGYVRNRSYNIYTTGNCVPNSVIDYPFDQFYFYQFNDGPNKNHLYVKGLEKDAFYQSNWFDYSTGLQLPISQIQQADNKNRIELNYPSLTFLNPVRPILWFTTQKINLRPEEVDVLDVDEVKEIKEDLDFIVYPNPFNEEITVISQQNDQLVIYSLTGKEVAISLTTESITKISTKNLERGVYFIKSISSNKTIKLVKQ